MPFIIGAETRSADSLEPHRRVSSTLDTKEKDSPYTSSEPSDYRFLPSLRRPSDPPLGSIGEGNDTGAPVDSTPTHYRFSSPPHSPALPTPSAFVPMDGMTPPLSTTPRMPDVSHVPTPTGTPDSSSRANNTDLLRRPSVPPKNMSSSSAPAAPPSAETPKPKSQALEFPDGPVGVFPLSCPHPPASLTPPPPCYSFGS